ncbi:MAG: prepilin-type N-terminal cleavage/methylation domain-containing protein [Myxococcales bacterium]|nr:prepilin-type N-terminal cleavage/methylation domain-containing protein [Myxococcales bacterium]
MAHRRNQRGFSLLEVMVALSILTVSLVILVETQSSAVVLTREAERIVTATDLSRLTLTNALLHVEQEGFQTADVHEYGDFDDLGSDVLDVQFGRDLKDYHWEYTITEVDISMIGDVASLASNLGGGGDDDGGGGGIGALLGGGGGDAGGPSDAMGSGGTAEMLGSLGFGPEQISETLSPYIREIRVRVWWGESADQAEEEGTEVVVTTHVINPTGVLSLEQQIPQ